jgi:CheY-like chemotaxis protein
MPIHTVLLVDDEPDVRKIGLVSLQKIGKLQVFLASDGSEALEVAAREQPDVILLDMMMPGIDGKQTLERLRANPVTARLPVVFLTASSSPTDVGAYMSLGAAGVLKKPFDPMRLAAQVRSLFEVTT